MPVDQHVKLLLFFLSRSRVKTPTVETTARQGARGKSYLWRGSYLEPRLIAQRTSDR